MRTTGIQVVAEFTGCSPELLNDQAFLRQTLAEGIERCGFHQVSLASHQFDPIGVTVVSIINESHIALHTYPEAHHISIDIFHCSTDARALYDLLGFLKERLRPKTHKYMQIMRGDTLELSESNAITSCSRYGFEIRYHIDEKLLETKSPYQKIEVIRNNNFGKMLFLDGDLQLAESDVHIYNQTMVEPLRGHPLGRVAILGGGDGGVLHELLREDPEHVTLVDIDRQVLAVSREFFPEVCGGSFDQPNVDIIIDDANNYLETAHDLDAVIYDLTTDPELLTRKDKKTFLADMFNKVQRSMREGAVLSMQCCSDFDAMSREIVQEVLGTHFRDVQFRTVFIPSFCEPWVFAAARRK